MKGIITTIQRMSIHDGPGIRSTLFLKGCDLRCAWCHNPETWSKHRQLQYIASKCIRCGTCIAACDQKALRAGERLVIDRAGCNRCGKCTEVCPTGAMSWIGREVSADEVVRELSADKIFFRTSGGEFDNGVSLLIHIHRVFFEGSVEYQPASSAVRNAVSTSVIREVREYRIISDLQ